MNKLLLLSMVTIITFNLFSQSPQKMSYQCVVRNSSGALVTNQSIGMRISILQGSATGTVVYQETYNPKPQTNANGLVSIEIGTGSVVSGTFSTIAWSAGPYFLKTETDPAGGTSYTISGTSQLLSVPYAFYTSSAGNGFASAYSVSEKRPVLNLTDGSVSLGSASNSNKLNVNGMVNITPGDNSSWGSTLMLDARSQAGGVLYTILSLSNGAGEGGGKFLIRNDNASSSFLMDNNGHTGINNITPAYGLDVTGDINFTGALLKNGSPLTNSQWITSGSNIYYNTGNVGVGSNTPSYPFTVLTGNNIGIYGESTSASASSAGIKGHASDINGTNYGVIGSTASRYGTGVLGDATSTEGENFGLVGRNIAAGGGGVYGYAASTYGVGYGVKGEVASPYAYSGYFTGGKFYVKGEINVNNNKITGVADPVNDKDAANKAYVDILLDKILHLQAELGAKDIDGNTYKAVVIGNQVWMAENLRTTKYNDGTPIPNITDNTAWAALFAPSYCWYNNQESVYKATYGALYNWYAVGTGNLCPTGWHVSTDDEWTTLSTYLGGESVASGKLKEAGTTHWETPNTGATNETGFTALPGGVRSDIGTYDWIGLSGMWWSSTEASATGAWCRQVGCDNTNVWRNNGNKRDGFSVRCLKD